MILIIQVTLRNTMLRVLSDRGWSHLGWQMNQEAINSMMTLMSFIITAIFLSGPL